MTLDRLKQLVDKAYAKNSKSEVKFYIINENEEILFDEMGMFEKIPLTIMSFTKKIKIERKKGMKKITIYKLINIIKNGIPPKKVKFENKIYEYQKRFSDYLCPLTDENKNEDVQRFLFAYILAKEENWLDIEVEIIEESILDEKEREYLSNIIKPFRNKVNRVVKYSDNENQEWITISVADEETIMLPLFPKGTMYKGMELDKEYTLEELEL